MIKSAAITRVKPAPTKEARAKKRDLKKVQAAERKATKQVRPSAINKRIQKSAVTAVLFIADNTQPTREEMLQKAETLGLKIDKRWSDATVLQKITEAINEQNKD